MMDIISLFYFCEAAKDLHFTNTARRLYITQQTLSMHIQKLEKYYGVPLFRRRPSLALTSEGELLLDAAEKILLENSNIRRRLSDSLKLEVGELRVGCAKYILRNYMPKVLSQFYQRYPNVRITLSVSNSKHLLERIGNGETDLIIIVYEAFNNSNLNLNFEYRYELNDSLYLLASDALLKQYYGKNADQLKESQMNGTDLTAFHELPFMLQYPGLRKREMLDSLFKNAGYSPRIILESAETEHFILVQRDQADLGAFFCTSSQLDFIKSQYPNLNAFPVIGESTKQSRTLMIVTNPNNYLASYGKYFIKEMNRAIRSANTPRQNSSLDHHAGCDSSQEDS